MSENTRDRGTTDDVAPTLDLETIEQRLARRDPTERAVRRARTESFLLGRDAMALADEHFASGQLAHAHRWYRVAARHGTRGAADMLDTVETLLDATENEDITAATAGTAWAAQQSDTDAPVAEMLHGLTEAADLIRKAREHASHLIGRAHDDAARIVEQAHDRADRVLAEARRRSEQQPPPAFDIMWRNTSEEWLGGLKRPFSIPVPLVGVQTRTVPAIVRDNITDSTIIADDAPEPSRRAGWFEDHIAVVTAGSNESSWSDGAIDEVVRIREPMGYTMFLVLGVSSEGTGSAAASLVRVIGDHLARQNLGSDMQRRAFPGGSWASSTPIRLFLQRPTLPSERIGSLWTPPTADTADTAAPLPLPRERSSSAHDSQRVSDNLATARTYHVVDGTWCDTSLAISDTSGVGLEERTAHDSTR